MLRVADLRVSYGPIRALDGVGLSVEEGEAVAIVGPNGAGKSTLLLTMAGVIAPDSGTVSFEGASIVGKVPEAILRLGMALVPEARHIFRTLSVEENLHLGATARSDRSEVEADLRMVLDLFPALEGYLHSSAGTLSGGEQQQLAIARALLSRPKLLLLDEPSLGLAPVVVDIVFDALERLREQGATIVLVEQNAARAIEFADRVYVLRTGVVELEGATADLSLSQDFESLYLGALPSEEG